MDKYNANNLIVSLTSHSVRLKYVGMTIFSILKYNNCKVVLTLYKDDVCNIPNDLSAMIKTRLVELIVSDVDLGPHLKYYCAMTKYKSNPIVTIDDDCLYSPDFIKSLYESYKTNPKHISCRRAHLMTFTDGRINPYNDWKMCVSQSTDNRHILPTGVGGVLYPPNILHVESIDLNELKQCFYADDIYLKVLENRLSIPINILNVKQRHPTPQRIEEVQKIGLCNVNVTGCRNDTYIQYFLADLA